MYNQEEIKSLLERFREDKKLIVELQSKYSISDILRVAIKNNMNDAIISLFQPIEINGEYIQFYDYYSLLDTHEIDYDDREYITKMRDAIDIDNPNTRNIKLKNSLAREVSGCGHPVNDEKDVRYYAEPACLESMLYFYRNNITTTMNDTQCIKGEDEQGICKVWIRYDTLSDENKEIADKLIEEGTAEFVEEEENLKIVSIFVPCQKEETIGTVSDRLMTIVKKFKKQISYRGLLTNETVMNLLAKTVRECLYNGEIIAEHEERYIDLFYKYIDEGLIKPLKLTDEQIIKRNNELVQAEDGIYSTIEFLKVIKELEPKIIDVLFEKTHYSIYCDEDGRYWESKEYYDKYLEEKKQIEAETKQNRKS